MTNTPNKENHRPELVILASTFPRWKGDSVPSFVQDFAFSVSNFFEKVLVIAPHYKGAANKEVIKNNVSVRRFRYFWPQSSQDIVYEGHAATKVKKSPVYALKLAGFLISNFVMVLRSCIGRRCIINAHWIIPQGAIAVLVGKIVRCPVVITVHGGDVFTLNGKILTKVKKWVLKNADQVVVNSSATKQACESIFPDRKYIIIPMGISVETFNDLKIDKNNSTLKLIFVGRLSVEKGVMYACKAVNEFVEKNPSIPIKLTIVGGGPEKTKIKNYINTEDLGKNIVLAGWKQHTELNSFYNAADIFIGPSIEASNGWKEALGLTFAEASAAGLPVIATDTGGIKDVVIDRETGILVEQKSIEGLVLAIESLARDRNLRITMGAKGRSYVSANFSWGSVAERYKKIFIA